jgi:hypothetical protein
MTRGREVGLRSHGGMRLSDWPVYAKLDGQTKVARELGKAVDIQDEPSILVLLTMPDDLGDFFQLRDD